MDVAYECSMSGKRSIMKVLIDHEKKERKKFKVNYYLYNQDYLEPSSLDIKQRGKQPLENAKQT